MRCMAPKFLINLISLINLNNNQILMTQVFWDLELGIRLEQLDIRTIRAFDALHRLTSYL